MNAFLNDPENVHDSMIMRFANKIVSECNVYRNTRLNFGILLQIVYPFEYARHKKLMKIIKYIRQGYPDALDIIFQLAINAENYDFIRESLTDFETTFDNDPNTNICPSGYLNNLVVTLPSVFPLQFSTKTVTPTPVILEEIDKIIDIAVDTNMPASEFGERIMFYSDKYSDVPSIVKKCNDLIQYYYSVYD